jgi:hypothetical protein
MRIKELAFGRTFRLKMPDRSLKWETMDLRAGLDTVLPG